MYKWTYTHLHKCTSACCRAGPLLRVFEQQDRAGGEDLPATSMGSIRAVRSYSSRE